ncbi:MAG TPA: vWA domain-containing protein, partial [Acidimicrobiales bacterium]|nr:vWA domain-containing protein [Acidimicrobiales bacterium]
MTPFTVQCSQNEFLPRGGDEMHAVLTVTASGTGAGAVRAEERSELILLDRSGSMSGKKLRSAKAATAAAIDCIPDGVRFGIISGNHKAEMTYPLEPPLAVASPETREAAKAEVLMLESAGGTAMGAWLRLAVQTLNGETGIRHAILLTDGKNESESSADLDAALQLAEGQLQCDCRGVGADWVVAELMKVATALVGTWDLVKDPADLEDDFSEMMREALSKQVPEVVLRVWTPQGGEVLTLKQMEPPLDLTAGRVEAGPRLGDYGTGSWG